MPHSQQLIEQSEELGGGEGHTPRIPALGSLRQEDCEFKTSMSYTARYCLKTKEQLENQQRMKNSIIPLINNLMQRGPN
jgi:hypothetical protein